MADYFSSGLIRQFLLLTLRLNMPAPTETHSRSQSTDSTGPQDKSQTSSSVGPGAYDDSVIPPSHHARTVVLCFDGTGDQFDGDVCAHSSS